MTFRESNYIARPSPAKRTRPLLARRVVALMLALFGLLATAEAQVTIFEEINGKSVACSRSGLSGTLKDCGANSRWYTYVFVGSISVVTPAADGEDELKIVPEEVFYGKPEPLMSVLTSQAACLPKLAAGDRWLFFFRKEPGKPIVLDYGDDSSPVSSADKQIEMLRRLQSIGDFGILRGNVFQSDAPSWKPVPYAIVTAARASDGKRFVSTTDVDGRYEFQPLPPGGYTITVDPVGSFRADPSQAVVSRGSCCEVALSRSPHAQLGGVVKRPDGSPVVGADIILISNNDSWYNAIQTDDRGHFSFDSLRAGNYIIGMNPPESSPVWRLSAGGTTDQAAPTASFYYPNAIDRSSALVIELASDEKRSDINIVVR